MIFTSFFFFFLVIIYIYIQGLQKGVTRNAEDHIHCSRHVSGKSDVKFYQEKSKSFQNEDKRKALKNEDWLMCNYMVLIYFLSAN